MEWYLQVWRNYAVFSGRARRQEYWWFTLVHTGVFLVLWLVDAVIGISLLSGLYALAALVPSIAVTVRRLHDTDRSAWWLLIGLVPFGGLVLLVFMLLEGSPSSNQYGPSPKRVETGYADASA